MEKIRKTERVKTTLLFICIGIGLCFAENAYSQNTYLSIEVENGLVKDVFKEIEKKSDFLIFYYDGVVDVNRRVSINVKNQTVNNILDRMFEGTDNAYVINNRQIFIIRKQMPKAEITAMISQQQNRVWISGTIVDSEGEAIIGANIVEKGTTNGGITDADGKFSLNVSPGATIIVSYVGYQTQEISIGKQTSFTISLKEGNLALEEVVVIGYGTRTKKDLTGAVSSMDSKEITKQVSMSPEFAMQGKMAGIYVSNVGSSPVARPTVRIRGVSTLGFNDPLYVVDGIPLTEGFSSSTSAGEIDIRGNVNVYTLINSNDIESISILKDASATAIYGVRASNGVILITTKRGMEGKPKVNLSLSYGIQNIYKKYDVVSIQEYVDIGLEAINNNKAYNKEYWYPLFDKSSSEYLGNSKDYTEEWRKAALIENAPIQDYNLSVTGGTKYSNYAVGAGYSSQDAALYADTYYRYSFFVNSDHKLTNWLKVGESYRIAYSKYDAHGVNSFTDVLTVIPWQPLYDASQRDGYASPQKVINGTSYGYGYGAATRGNFLGNDLYNVSQRDILRNMGTFYAELSPLKGLRLRGTFSFDTYMNTRETYEEPGDQLYSVVPSDRTSYGNTYVLRKLENTNIVKEFLVGYNNTFADHSVDLILNAMGQDVRWTFTQASMDNNSPITSWDQRYINEGWSSENKGLMYNRYASGLIGYMGRLSYNYAQKYYLDVTVRRDGTSKFGPGYKWGTFPSVAGAWRISSESFLQDIPWMNDLKIRTGWGQSGNQETRDYAFLSMVNLNPKAAFGNNSSSIGNGTLYQAAALGDFPIADMSWETVTTFSAGFDLVALSNKLNLTAEYYNRQTDGILQSIVIPWTIGALNSPVVNLAKVLNRGFEFQVGYNDRFGDIGFNVSANLTTVYNEVSDLYRNQPTTSGNLRIENGYSINYIYGYKADGIFQTDAEVSDFTSKINDTGYMTQKSPGDVRYVDLYGAPTDEDPEGSLKHLAPDGKIDAYDMTYLGKTIPGYYYGFNLGADYKNWDVSLAFRGVGDVQAINSVGLQTVSASGMNFQTDYRKRWTPENHSNTIPRAIQGDPSGNNRVSSRFVQDAGFLRFQNFQVGYTFRGSLINKINVDNLRCYLSGSNLFVITPYTDLDPENLTTPTVFTLGINIVF